MKYIWIVLILLALAPLSAQTAPKKQKAKKAPAMQTITGCMDEKSMEYVLRADDNLTELAMLESVGFEPQNFARFVGHKVAVSGQLVKSSGTPTLRVTSLDHVKNISDLCVPAEPPPAK